MPDRIEWELGAAVGTGAYKGLDITTPSGTAQAGIGDRLVAGAVIGQDPFQWVGGELRYLYQKSEPFMSLNGRKVTLDGESHAIHYDALFHVRPKGSRWRPFVAVGAGVKIYRATGEPADIQTISGVGSLVPGDDVRLLVTVGGGVKYDLTDHVRVRFDLKDYMTPYPGRIFAIATGASAGGMLHQITPMVGIGYRF